MVRTFPESQNLVTDAWVRVTWEEFLTLANNSQDEKGRFYYDQGYMKIEIMPIGSGHSQDNTVTSQVIALYATLKNIRIKGFTNGSFRKSGVRECQPDVAFYIGSNFKFPPQTNTPVDVNEFGAPTLAIEVAATSLSDDLGQKRLLYERLGVQEYWVVDVSASQVIAFEVAGGGSRQIQESKVLPGLQITVVEEVLRRSQTEEDGEVNRWLLRRFSQE